MKLASLAQRKLKQKRSELERALHRRLTTNQSFVLRESLQDWEDLEAADRRVTKEIDRYLQGHAKLARAHNNLDTIPGLGVGRRKSSWRRLRGNGS